MVVTGRYRTITILGNIELNVQNDANGKSSGYAKCQLAGLAQFDITADNGYTWYGGTVQPSTTVNLFLYPPKGTDGLIPQAEAPAASFIGNNQPPVPIAGVSYPFPRTVLTGTFQLTIPVLEVFTTYGGGGQYPNGQQSSWPSNFVPKIKQQNYVDTDSVNFVQTTNHYSPIWTAPGVLINPGNIPSGGLNGTINDWGPWWYRFRLFEMPSTTQNTVLTVTFNGQTNTISAILTPSTGIVIDDQFAITYGHASFASINGTNNSASKQISAGGISGITFRNVLSVDTGAGDTGTSQVYIDEGASFINVTGTSGTYVSITNSGSANVLPANGTGGLIQATVKAFTQGSVPRSINLYGRVRNFNAMRLPPFLDPPQGVTTALAANGSLNQGTTYYYVVTSYNAKGESFQSSEVSRFIRLPNGGVTVSWNPVAGATGYKIYSNTTSGVYTNQFLASVVGGNTTSYTDLTNVVGPESPPIMPTNTVVPLIFEALDKTDSGPYINTQADGTINVTESQSFSAGSCDLQLGVVPFDPNWTPGTLEPERSYFSHVVFPYSDSRNPASLYIDPVWLQKNESSSGARCLGLGRRYAAFTLLHKGTLLVDACTSLTNWSSNQNAQGLTNTLSIANGGITIATPSSSPPSVSSTNIPAGSQGETGSNEYRYLQIQVKSIGASNLPFSIQTTDNPFGGLNLGAPPLVKTWNASTGADGVATTITLDLCAPPSLKPKVDSTNSRYGRVEGTNFGVILLRQLTFSGFTASSTYVITNIQFVTQDHAKLDISLPPSIQGYDPGTWWRNLFADVDGKSALEMPYVLLTNQTPSMETINNRIGFLNQNPAYTATAMTSYSTDGYHDQFGPAAWLGGGGTTWDPTNGWLDQLDIDISATQTLYAQDTFDGLDWYPGCGDPWYPPPNDANGNPVYTYGPIPFRFNKILRSQVRGLVYNADLTPAFNPNIANVVVKDNPNHLNIYGTAVVNSIGEYTTSDPSVPNIPVDISAWTSPKQTDDLNAVNLEQFRRNRVVLVLPSAGATPSNMQDTYGRYHEATCNSTNTQILYYRSDCSVPGPWRLNGVVAVSGASLKDPRMITDHRGRIHMAFYGDPGTGLAVYEITSDDSGASWNTPVTLSSSGKHPNLLSSPFDGSILRAVYVPGSPGSIQGTIQNAGDQNPSSPVIWTDQTGAALSPNDDTFSLAVAYDNQARWLLSIPAASGSGTMEYFSMDGKTWTNLASAGFSAGKHPALCVSPHDGSILRAVYVPGSPGNIQGTIQNAGDPNPSTPVIWVDQTGAALSPNDDTFALSCAFDNQGRWSLVIVPSGGSTTLDYWSEDGKTWTMVS